MRSVEPFLATCHSGVRGGEAGQRRTFSSAVNKASASSQPSGQPPPNAERGAAGGTEGGESGAASSSRPTGVTALLAKRTSLIALPKGAFDEFGKFHLESDKKKEARKKG